MQQYSCNLHRHSLFKWTRYLALVLLVSSGSSIVFGQIVEEPNSKSQSGKILSGVAVHFPRWFPLWNAVSQRQCIVYENDNPKTFSFGSTARVSCTNSGAEATHVTGDTKNIFDNFYVTNGEHLFLTNKYDEGFKVRTIKINRDSVEFTDLLWCPRESKPLYTFERFSTLVEDDTLHVFFAEPTTSVEDIYSPKYRPSGILFWGSLEKSGYREMSRFNIPATHDPECGVSVCRMNGNKFIVFFDNLYAVIDKSRPNEYRWMEAGFEGQVCVDARRTPDGAYIVILTKGEDGMKLSARSYDTTAGKWSASIEVVKTAEHIASANLLSVGVRDFTVNYMPYHEIQRTKSKLGLKLGDQEDGQYRPLYLFGGVHSCAINVSDAGNRIVLSSRLSKLAN